MKWFVIFHLAGTMSGLFTFKTKAAACSAVRVWMQEDKACEGGYGREICRAYLWPDNEKPAESALSAEVACHEDWTKSASLELERRIRRIIGGECRGLRPPLFCRETHNGHVHSSKDD